MSTPIHVRASLPTPVGGAFLLREAIPLTVVLSAPGPDAPIVPDPLGGDKDSMVPVLTLPDGTEKRISLFRTTARRGGHAPDTRYMILPGEDTLLVFNIASLFEITTPGDYAVHVETDWDPQAVSPARDTSPKQAFTVRAPGAPRFLELVPSEAAARGFHALVWGEQGTSMLSYSYGPRMLDRWGARPIGEGPDRGRPILSVARAGAPQSDRWVCWISDGQSLTALFDTEEAARCVAPVTTALPPSCRGAKAVAPALAEDPVFVPMPDDADTPAPDPPPPAALGLITDSAGGGVDLVLAHVHSDGTATFDRGILVSADRAPDEVCFAAASATSAGHRVFVFVIPAATSGGFVARGLAIPPSAPSPQTPTGALTSGPGAPAAVDLAMIAGDEVIGGDVRADLGGRVNVGVLVRRGAQWMRVTFTPPAGDVIAEDPIDPPRDAQAVACRLDAEGKMHVVFRAPPTRTSPEMLCYVPPGHRAPTWSDARVAAKGSLAHIHVRETSGPVLVYHDSDAGLGFERMGP